LNGLGVRTLESLPGVKQLIHTEKDGSATLEFILAEEPILGSVVNTLTAENVRILNLTKREPTLEDVFVELVGRSMADVEKGDGEASHGE
jgi:ABC-2 type transport system ATP-binding protein